jgi:hypothetical protein
MMLSDRSHQRQRGGLWSTNYQICIQNDGAARKIAQDSPAASIASKRLLEVIRERVFELIERHGIDLPTMAEILDVPLSMLGREELLDRLDNPSLDRLASLFCVRREWLVGQDEYPMRGGKQWYNDPASLIQHLLELEKKGLQPWIYFLKLAHMDAEKAMEEEGHSHRVGISIACTHGTPTGRTFRTFEPWQWEP